MVSAPCFRSSEERIVIKFDDHGEKKFVTTMVLASLKKSDRQPPAEKRASRARKPKAVATQPLSPPKIEKDSSLNARQKRLFEESLRKNPNLKMPTEVSSSTELTDEDLALLKQGVGDKSGRAPSAAASRPAKPPKMAPPTSRPDPSPPISRKRVWLSAPRWRRQRHFLPHFARSIRANPPNSCPAPGGLRPWYGPQRENRRQQRPFAA